MRIVKCVTSLKFRANCNPAISRIHSGLTVNVWPDVWTEKDAQTIIARSKKVLPNNLESLSLSTDHISNTICIKDKKNRRICKDAKPLSFKGR